MQVVGDLHGVVGARVGSSFLTESHCPLVQLLQPQAYFILFYRFSYSFTGCRVLFDGFSGTRWCI